MTRQGDVQHVRNAASGNIVAWYVYNAWGYPIAMGRDFAEINPLRYRGYYWDSALGMYYLNSRFYDPYIGRFINADAFLSTGQGLLGFNMFAYCLNNPVNYIDPDGYFAIGILIGRVVARPIARAVLNQTGHRTTTTEGRTTTSTTNIGPIQRQTTTTVGSLQGVGRGQSTIGSAGHTNVVGVFGRASAINETTRTTIGNENWGVTRTSAGDIGVATGNAGFVRGGQGMGIGGRVSALAGRETGGVRIAGWEIEVGWEVNLLTAGASASIGQ